MSRFPTLQECEAETRQYSLCRQCSGPMSFFRNFYARSPWRLSTTNSAAECR